MSSGVEFDEDKYGLSGQSRAQQRFQAPPMSSGGNSKMAQWLVSHGFAKSGSGAQVVLVIVIIINIAITYFVIKYFI